MICVGTGGASTSEEDAGQRYGQRHDMAVVTFFDKSNGADQRVYELLSRKFQLFSGVFGASNERLGTIGSGVEFEKRIVSIYQTCAASPPASLTLAHSVWLSREGGCKTGRVKLVNCQLFVIQ
jgi:hypothetical protein